RFWHATICEVSPGVLRAECRASPALQAFRLSELKPKPWDRSIGAAAPGGDPHGWVRPLPSFAMPADRRESCGLWQVPRVSYDLHLTRHGVVEVKYRPSRG